MAIPLMTGDPLVDFTLPALDDAFHHSIEARSDGLLLFVFWKRTCGTCQFAFPYLQRFKVLYGDSGFRIWGIAQETPDDARSFKRQYGATFTQLIDEGLELTEKYQLTSVPALYLVDSSDRILYSLNQFDTEGFNHIAKIVAERTGVDYTPVVRPEDGAPANKPG